MAAPDIEANPTQPNAEEQAGFLSRLLIFWIQPLLNLGSTKQLEPQDLGTIGQSDEADAAYSDFNTAWQAELSRTDKPPKLRRALFAAAGKGKILFALLCYSIHCALDFIPPMVLSSLVRYLEAPHVFPLEERERWLLVASLFVTPFLSQLFFSVHSIIMVRVGLRLRTGVSLAVYRKSFRLSGFARRGVSTGQIVNAMSQCEPSEPNLLSKEAFGS